MSVSVTRLAQIAARFAELTEAQWHSGIDSTLLSVVRLCRLVLPAMQARRWGRVVHLTSFVAKQPVPLLTISSTLRAGLSALTKTLADQVGPDGVTVNVALTGPLDFDQGPNPSLLGSAAASDTSNNAAATAVAVKGGAGDDQIVNRGRAAANASASASSAAATSRQRAARRVPTAIAS